MEDAEQAQVNSILIRLQKQVLIYFVLQKAARDAIKKANEDIATAKADLEEVKSHVLKFRTRFKQFFENVTDQHRN